MFKTRNIRNKKHLQVVAGKFHCLLWNVAKHECNGNIQAQHLLKPYEGFRGVGMKAGDNNAVPLCTFHHQKLHMQVGNEDLFWKSYGLSGDYGREKAKYIWENYKKWKK